MWRSKEYLPEELVFHVNYLGADQASFTLNFSKSAAQVIGRESEACTAYSVGADALPRVLRSHS